MSSLSSESQIGRQSNVFSRTRRCFGRLFWSCTTRNSVGPDTNVTERVSTHRVPRTSSLFIKDEPRTVAVKGTKKEKLKEKKEKEEEEEEDEEEEVKEEEEERKESKEEVKDSEYEEEAEQEKEQKEGKAEGKEEETRHQSEPKELGMVRTAERKNLEELELAELKELEDEVMQELQEMDWLLKRKQQLREKTKSVKLAQMMENPELVKEIEYLERWRSWTFQH